MASHLRQRRNIKTSHLVRWEGARPRAPRGFAFAQRYISVQDRQYALDSANQGSRGRDPSPTTSVESSRERYLTLRCLLFIHIPVIHNFGNHAVTDFEGSVETRDIS